MSYPESRLLVVVVLGALKHKSIDLKAQILGVKLSYFPQGGRNTAKSSLSISNAQHRADGSYWAVCQVNELTHGLAHHTGPLPGPGALRVLKKGDNRKAGEGWTGEWLKVR